MSEDDLGTHLDLTDPPRRIVSLIPSLTEALALDTPDRLVGATTWCTHPADLDVPRVRGTKNPDLNAIRNLQPDLVIANQEENREIDVRRLRAAGINVWVTRIEAVDQALASLDRLYEEALQVPRPAWLTQAHALWSQPVPEPRGRIAVPIWRDPWMVLGPRTYAHDLLTRLGWDNAFGDDSERYPRVEVADIDRAGIDLVLLPDEPYVFTADDGPEAFQQVPTRLVSGRLLTWYGPAMVAAHQGIGRTGGTEAPDPGH